MKKSFHPMLMFAALLATTFLTTGCPVGISYPFCEESQMTKVDKNLLGTWNALVDSAEVVKVKISKKNDITYQIEVLEKGENYMLDAVTFNSWTTQLNGESFIFSQATEGDDQSYYLYHFKLDGKQLFIEDVSLLEGGIDAVTSAETFQKEVVASMKKPDCFSGRFAYVKQ